MRTLRPTILLLSLSILTLTPLIAQSLRCVQVRSKTTWQSSGWTVSTGDNIAIFARGTWAYADSTYFGAWVGPEGQAYNLSGANPYIAPNANDFSLIAKIGTGGTPFGIGQFYQFTASSSGTIYFAMNEQIGGDGDNAGYMIVGGLKLGTPLVTVSQGPTGNGPSDGFELLHNYPNPFNPSTSIEYRLAQHGNVQVDVFDSQGQKVRTLASGPQDAGSHHVTWDGRNDGGAAVASGAYFYQVAVNGVAHTKQMLLIK